MTQAQDIAHAQGTGIAPTPQNTPAAHNTNSVLSRPQIPSTLAEEKEEEEVPTISSAAVAAGLTSHPAFASLVQGRLNSLVGRSSGYIESLPPVVRRRIDALKALQSQYSDVEAEFQKEIFELEKKFAAKFAPVYERRKALVVGDDEPTKEEVDKGFAADSDNEDDDNAPARASTPTPEEVAEAPKGIPEFWLTALKNHLGISDLITERDEDALKFLSNVSLSYPSDKPGFIITFEFDEGAKSFFSNTTLTKTYYYQDEVGYEGDFVYERAIGTEINWVEGKDLTVKVETRKQRNKNTNQTRVIKKVVPVDSFFSFFKPPTPPTDEEEDVTDDVEEKLELDYQIGEDLKERVIPRAVDFFTGKALRYEEDASDFESDDFLDEGESDDEEDSDEDAPRGNLRAPVPPPQGNTPTDPAECKQS